MVAENTPMRPSIQVTRVVRPARARAEPLPPPTAPGSGDIIGPYRLIRLLGEGGMGAVWLAEHTIAGRRAAIKVLHPEYSRNDEVVKRFFNEGKAVAGIAAPGIVKVFDVGVHGRDTAYIVMEVLEGEGLNTRLRRVGRLAPFCAVRFAQQIAIALSAAHAKGVIHRDLKPGNLFIVGDLAATDGERVKVLDFGVAKVTSRDVKDRTMSGIVLGTPTYMSPEQCRGSSSIDHRADIYSLGAVLFCMVTGRAPFSGAGWGDVMLAHLHTPPPVPSTLVPDLLPAIDDVILRCLEKDPANRFQSMDELATALGAIASVMRNAYTLLGVQVAPVVAHDPPTPAPAPRRAPTAPPAHAAHAIAPRASSTLSGASGESAAPPRRRWQPRPRTVMEFFTAFVIGALLAVVIAVGGKSPAKAPMQVASAPAVVSPRAADLRAELAAALLAPPPPPPPDAGIRATASAPPDAGAPPNASAPSPAPEQRPADDRARTPAAEPECLDHLD